MKWIFTVMALLFLTSGIIGQTIFDIQIDQIYQDNGNLVFINKGEVKHYTCSVYPAIQKDFVCKLVLECDEGNNLSDEATQVDYDDIIKFKRPSEFAKWLKDKKFTKQESLKNRQTKSCLQLQNKHLFVEILYSNFRDEKPEWTLDKVDFWEYTYLRINNDFLVIALVYEDDADPIGYLIPTKDGGILTLKNYAYYPQQNRIDSIELSQYVNTKDYFRISKEGEGYKVYDKLFHEDILNETFSEVKIGNIFNFVKSKEEITIYDKFFEKIIAKNITATYEAPQSIQILNGNKIQWIDKAGNIQDTLPVSSLGVCGNTIYVTRRIEKQGDDFRELVENNFMFTIGGVKRDSVKIPSRSNVKEIKYLNNSIEHAYDGYSDLKSVFSFPYTYYYILTDDSQQIIQVTNKRDSLEREINYQKPYAKNGQADKGSIDQAINALQDDVTIKVIFEGNIEVKGYYHPVKFMENGLFGYFPQNKSAKYRKLEGFNFFFAEFELENGRKGWLDIYGNEYLK